MTKDAAVNKGNVASVCLFVYSVVVGKFLDAMGTATDSGHREWS